MGERWFSEDELEQMSRPTMDRAIDALDRGDADVWEVDRPREQALRPRRPQRGERAAQRGDRTRCDVGVLDDVAVGSGREQGPDSRGVRAQDN